MRPQLKVARELILYLILLEKDVIKTDMGDIKNFWTFSKSIKNIHSLHENTAYTHF